MADEQTLDFYNANAAAYAERRTNGRHSETLGRFLSALPSGAATLDLGCGAGWAAAEMARRGHTVTAVDGSAGMVEEARRRTGLDVKQMRFDELDAVDAFDGVFASFSLLHAPRADAPDLLNRVWRALKPGGVLFVGVKSRPDATGEHRDRLGRFYTHYERTDLETLLRSAGFALDWIGEGSGIGADGVATDHLYVLARRGGEADKPSS